MLSEQGYIGRKIYNRSGDRAGEITKTSLCRLEGCGGIRLHVRWDNGKRTYPCSEGCTIQSDGSLRID